MESSIDIQNCVTTLDLDKTEKYLAAAGKEAFKLIEIKENQKMEIKSNLNKRVDLSSISYVEFNKSEHNKNLLLAVSPSGNYSIINIETIQQSILSYIFFKKKVKSSQLHTSAINKINWHQDGKRFVSGSQDQTIQIVHIDNKNVCMILERYSAIKDVKFNPLQQDYLMVACENGNLEYFDLRKFQEPVCEYSTVNSIITMDWNKERNLLATGSTDKEIKLWSVNTQIEWKCTIQHLDGSSLIKWNRQELSVSSLNRDNSVTVFDIASNRPKKYIKGHTDLITSYVYFDQYIITGSKDKTVKIQNINNFLQIYERCPMYPVAMNQYNNVIFKLENLEIQENETQVGIIKAKTVPENRNYSMAFQENSKIVWNPRIVFYMTDIDSMEEQIDYLQNNYISTKIICFDHNSQVAQNRETSEKWSALKCLINEYQQLSEEYPNKKKLSKLLCDRSADQSEDESQHESELEQVKDIKKLYKYFEKYPAAFKQEIELKHFNIEKNTISIRYERIPYYNNILDSMESTSKFYDKDSQLLSIKDAIQDFIQQQFDQFDMTTGYWMFLCSKNYFTFQRQIIEKWTQSYIDLLLQYEFYSSTVKIAHECPIEAIQLSNKSAVVQVCQQCADDLNNGYCQKCQQYITCIICQKQVKGLYFWCQQCQHGGHNAEMAQWFDKQQYCPSGCGHQCLRTNSS